MVTPAETTLSETQDFTGTIPSLSDAPYDPGPVREKLRGRLAVALIALVATVVAGSYLLVLLGWGVDTARSLLELLFTPIIALAGSALGFYFGGKSTQ